MAFMRPGQHNNNNKNRNRNRNRRTGGMGNSGGGNSGGNTSNRVYDSNGPDVKLRGTAQTIAEKYMQLGRDAQSSGDIVMAESYYQFGDHYYRLWLAAQPAGQPLQFSRRMAEEDMEDEAGDGPSEGEDDSQNGEVVTAAEGSGEVAASGEEGAEQQPSDGQQQDGQYQRQNRQRDFNNNSNNNNRDGNRNNSRQRWPRRNDRNQQQDGNGQPVEGTSVEGQEPRNEPRQERPQQVEAVNESSDNWEAPSFLKRPAPAPMDDVIVDQAQAAPAPRVRRARSEPKPAPEDAPQGD